jgi:glycosyltransferase EpsF
MPQLKHNKLESKPPFRILHVAFTLHDKSLQDWLFSILKLTKNDDVVIDLMTTADEARVFQPIIEEIGGNIRICPHPKNKGAFLRYVRECLSVDENTRQYDLIHAHPFIMSGEIMMQAFRANIPVRLVHAHLDKRKARRDKSFLSRLRHKISKLLIQRLSTHGLAVNSETAEDIYGKNWYKDGRWQLMPYGIDLSKTHHSEDKNLKTKLGIPSGAKVITQVGDFYFEKNHDLTLQLFAKEAHTNLSLVLILSGIGPLKEKIEDQAIKMGIDERIIFLGRDIGVTDVLSVTDLILAPVLYDFDLSPLLQAQALGIPVLASDHLSHNIAMHDALMNFISLDHDIGVWSKAFKNVLSQPKMDTDKARELVVNSRYNIEHNAQILVGLYQEVRAKELN